MAGVKFRRNGWPKRQLEKTHRRRTTKTAPCLAPRFPPLQQTDTRSKPFRNTLKCTKTLSKSFFFSRRLITFCGSCKNAFVTEQRQTIGIKSPILHNAKLSKLFVEGSIFFKFSIRRISDRNITIFNWNLRVCRITANESSASWRK